MVDTRQILIKILDIIEYQDDKDSFVNDFLTLAYDTTTVEIMQMLSNSDRKKLEEELTNLKDIKEAHIIFGKYIPKERYLEHLAGVTEKLLGDYFKTIEPTLNDDQSEKLANLLSKTN